jgi:tRNA pseudouridine55 synthase
MADGVLLLDKQPGETSTGCVEKVRKLFGKKWKTGHGGTLDSPASGLLVILVGAATRLCPFIQCLPKVYEVEAQLGGISDTDDASGHIRLGSLAALPRAETFERELLGFVGLRLQIPPTISAIHISGKRAHRLARLGETPQLSPRPVTITSFSGVSGPDSGGRVRFRVLCHKGTYVRSLVRDLGTRLGCGAYVLSLKRISIGNFRLEEAIPVSRLLESGEDSASKRLLAVERLLEHFIVYRLPQDLESDIRNGKPIPCSSLQRIHWGLVPESGHVALRTGNLVSFALWEPPSHYRPDIVLALEDRG